MKSLKIIILIFFSYISCEQSIKLEADKFYNEKNFEKAVDLYDSLSEKDVSILVNMGNCYYKLENYLSALKMYKKAQKMVDVKNLNIINHNISLTYKKLNQVYENKSKTLFDYFPVFYIQIVTLILWYLFIFCFIKFWPNFKILWVLLFLFNGFCISRIYNYDLEQNEQIGIICQNNVKLYSGCSLKFHSIGELNLADEVKILNIKQEWVKVARNNLQGWVLKNTLSIV